MKIDLLSHTSIITRNGAEPQGSTVMALGTFDGVHIAHKKLIDEAKKLKKRLHAQNLGVWCFEDIPAAILSGKKLMSLTDRTEKLNLLFESGADIVVMADFEHYRSMSAEDFVNEILIIGLECKGAICGYDHRFGKDGRGNSSLLEALIGDENTVILPEMKLDGETVSSTAIRNHLKNGETEKASRMLGRNISFTSPVLEGKKLGRQLGSPTANQIIPDGLSQLKYGVYATKCHVDGQSYIGVSNIGIRPSIDARDDHKLNCETYIFDFEGRLYGKQMTVELCSHLRDEMKFSSLEELAHAIEADKQNAAKYFCENKRRNS